MIFNPEQGHAALTLSSLAASWVSLCGKTRGSEGGEKYVLYFALSLYLDQNLQACVVNVEKTTVFSGVCMF